MKNKKRGTLAQYAKYQTGNTVSTYDYSTPSFPKGTQEFINYNPAKLTTNKTVADTSNWKNTREEYNKSNQSHYDSLLINDSKMKKYEKYPELLKNNPGDRDNFERYKKLIHKKTGGKVGYQTGNAVKRGATGNINTPFQEYVQKHPASLYDDSKSSAVDTLTSSNFDPRFTNGKFDPKSDQLEQQRYYRELTPRDEKDIEQGVALEIAYQNTFKMKPGLRGPYNMSYMPDSIANTMRGKNAAARYNPLGYEMGGPIARLKKKK